MQQLQLFPEEMTRPVAKNNGSGSKKLSRTKLAHLDYGVTCPLSFVQASGWCHQCVLFEAAEVDNSANPPKLTITCTADQYQGPQYGFKPGLIRDGWRTKIAWVAEVYENKTVASRT